MPIPSLGTALSTRIGTAVITAVRLVLCRWSTSAACCKWRARSERCLAALRTDAELLLIFFDPAMHSLPSYLDYVYISGHCEPMQAAVRIQRFWRFRRQRLWMMKEAKERHSVSDARICVPWVHDNRCSSVAVSRRSLCLRLSCDDRRLR